ncbi:MAG: site-specific DNA-methyltransferase [Spirochaetales bacterium]|nr:site-specific DNA-methyltransferase [Spirochaetales bacterium]
MIKPNAIIHGDCLKVMPDILDDSIDMILCDLPYGMTACKWDKIIPFDALWREYCRIIKEKGVIVLTASEPFASKLRISNLNMYRYDWIWEKDQGSNFLQIKTRPFKVHEVICIFSPKAMQYSYNPQMTKGKPYVSSTGNTGEVYGKSKKVITVNNGFRYPRSIIQVNRERGLHPTQKPVKLFEYFIKTYTQEKDVVLDNCAGSGTTGIACLQTGRRYILIEKEKKYFDIIQERIRRYFASKHLCN